MNKKICMLNLLLLVPWIGTVFGDSLFKEIIKLKWGGKVDPNPIWLESWSRGNLDTEEPAWVTLWSGGHLHTKEKDLMETNPTGTLILEF
jgi:hypothetical protein